MSRDLSLNARVALNASATAEVFLILLTINHDDLALPIQVTSDTVETQHLGDTFVPFPFQLHLPDDDDGKIARARLIIDNVDRSIVHLLRRLTSSPTVEIKIIRHADPDVVEARFSDFRFTNISYDSHNIEGDLTLEDFISEPYPSGNFSPAGFPSLF